MDFERLAELLFPSVTMTPADIEAKYPPRTLPEGAKVTRFAPSPTGFVHFGGLFPSTVGERLAHQSGGIFFLRIEDTDAKREVEGAAEGLIKTLEQYGVSFDEGAVLGDDKGNYGPYRQSKRAFIYHVFAKQLVKEGKAYPCFMTEEEYEELQAVDKKEEIKNRDWTASAAQQREKTLKQRQFTLEDVENQLRAGNPFVLRILSDGNPEKKTVFTDLIKGKLELPENDEDFVLLKSDGIPTYHFAHAVDDHLMGTTHVIRGEEWLPSLPKHMQLFRYLGFKMPKFMHIAQIMRLDENGNKKKLSKRDMGANLNDYERMGYAPQAVIEYVMTLLNSNYEEWHTANPEKSYKDFPFSIKKMSTSGCLFDFNKLNDVSKNVLCAMSASQIFDGCASWADKYDTAFAAMLRENRGYAEQIFAIGRGGKKPRKDFATWQEAKDYISFFYDGLFETVDKLPTQFSPADVKNCLQAFSASYDETADNATWFENVKSIASQCGFCPDVKAFKASPEAYKGHVGDVSSFLRLAVTGRMNAPDLYTVMQILGKDRTLTRIANFSATLE